MLLVMMFRCLYNAVFSSTTPAQIFSSVFLFHWYCVYGLIYLWVTLGRLRGLVGSELDHRSVPPEFKSWRRNIWRSPLWLIFITFGGRLAHLSYHVHKSGRKTSIIITCESPYDHIWPALRLTKPWTYTVMIMMMMMKLKILVGCCIIEVDACITTHSHHFSYSSRHL